MKKILVLMSIITLASCGTGTSTEVKKDSLILPTGPATNNKKDSVAKSDSMWPVGDSGKYLLRPKSSFSLK